MKDILIFASESQHIKEIVQYLISKHFNITIFTFKPLLDKEIFVGASPLQINVLITNIANYYNWNHEIHKYDVIINALKINDFPRQNRGTVFANFTASFAESTADLGKTVIYLSNIHNDSYNANSIKESEDNMIKTNQKIFYIKYGLLINSNSRLLTHIVNTKFIFSSSKVLKSAIQITNVSDISHTIFEIIAQKEYRNNIALSSETFTLKDILLLMQNFIQSKKYIIVLPHFVLMFASRIVTILLPQKLYPRFYNYGILSNIVYIGQNHFRPNVMQSYTLFTNVASKHAENLFTPHIE